VDWRPRSGSAAWQLLGHLNKNAPALKACDFRTAKGVYVLYDDYGPKYSGIARGAGGLGARLRTHHTKPPRGVVWSRFSWLSFGDIVRDPRYYGWEQVKRRSKPVPTDPEASIREIEALLIALMGTTQNKMKFQQANEWKQLSADAAELIEDSEAVDPRPFTFRRSD
jgi:hypothetical protein